MNESRIEVLGIGNAIVDIIAEVDDAFLEDLGLVKETMHLVDHDMATRILGTLDSPTLVSGGSAANTIAGLAAVGGNGCFVGKVHDDELGRTFADDLRARDVAFATRPATDGPETGRSLVLVTPDGLRTMCTWLGASVRLETSDLDAADIANSSVVFLEGYLWDAPSGPEVFARAAGMAAAAGHKVAMTLSDSFCVDRHRKDFRAFLRNHVNIVFANETEVVSLFEGEGFVSAASSLAQDVEIAVVTRGEKGSVVLSRGSSFEVEAVMTRVVDVTGAGDLYAAGFLYGYTQALSLDRSARIASVCAAEIISHFGARANINLRSRIAETLG